MNIAIMVRRTVARTVCGSATRWNRGATVTGPVEHAWWPSPSPQPPSSPALRERKGGIMSPHLSPSSLPLLHREQKWGERSRGDPAPASVNDTETTTTPLPQCGRGAGGEGGPPGSENVQRMAEQNVGPATQWLLGRGTFPMKHPSF